MRCRCWRTQTRRPAPAALCCRCVVGLGVGCGCSLCFALACFGLDVVACLLAHALCCGCVYRPSSTHVPPNDSRNRPYTRSRIQQPASRATLGDRLNGALLAARGRPAAPALERLYRQTAVVLEELKKAHEPRALVLDAQGICLQAQAQAGGGGSGK